jgi:phosphoribosylcarboxyaminoimidazole (NCAIR) mutase
MLAAKHPDIAKKIEKYRKDLESSVLEKVNAVGRMGVRKYLEMLQNK